MLLPLWEGFDEAFHYAYVQELALRRQPPVLGRSVLSREIAESLQLVPVSHIVRRSYPALTTYDEFFRLHPHQQARRKLALSALSPNLRRAPSAVANYEAHQPPAAYLPLAAADALLAAQPLPLRALVLRAIAGVAACLIAAAAAFHLARTLGLNPNALLFLLFSTQMFYATVCRISNDWLAVPLAAALFAAASRSPITLPRRVLAIAVLLACGLLAKAYFLVFLPAAFLLTLSPGVKRRGLAAIVLALIVLLAAGPWYARNLRLYGSLTGTVESVSGLGAPQVLAAIPSVPWASAIPYIARGALWTANNTFATFSRSTLNAMLALLAAGLLALLTALRNRRPALAELVMIGGSLLFAAALVYATAQDFLFRRGASAGTSVWYVQPVFIPVLCLSLAGLAAHRWGRWVQAGMLLLWTWTISATWWLKLIPLYAGFEGRANLRPLLDWYRSQPGPALLANTALGPAQAVYALAALSTVAALALCAAILLTPRPSASPGAHAASR